MFPRHITFLWNLKVQGWDFNVCEICFSFVQLTKPWSLTETFESSTTLEMWCKFLLEITLHLLFLSSSQLWSGMVFWFNAASGMNQNSCHTELQSAAIAYQLDLMLVTCCIEYDFVLGIETKGEYELGRWRGEQCFGRGGKLALFIQESYTELIKSCLDICLVWLSNSLALNSQISLSSLKICRVVLS